MGLFQSQDGSFHPDRRNGPRAKVDTLAVLELPFGKRSCKMEDLSERGARLSLENPPMPGTTAILRWNDLDIYCHVMWVKPDCCGLAFDQAIPREMVFSELPQDYSDGESEAPAVTPRRLFAC